MGVKWLLGKDTIFPDFYQYEAEFNRDDTEKHIILEGARFHVLGYDSIGEFCSAPRCERNKYREQRMIDRIIAERKETVANGSHI